MKTFDVITFGETMLRLSPAGFQTLEQAEFYEARCAGTESNVAVAAARLGLQTGWFSKMVDNPIGRKIANIIRQHGVDVSHIIWTEQGRNGVIFMELGQRPRPSEVIYDRADSAASQLDPCEVDWGVLKDARHLHLTGITPALSSSCEECVRESIRHAREYGLTVSFDVNYRHKLWPAPHAAEVLEPLMKGVDVLLSSGDDIESLFGIQGAPEDAVRAAAERFGSKWTVLTLGGDGAVGLLGDQLCRRSSHRPNVVDRIGAGDAFVGGFLHGYFREDLDLALRYGLAMAALKMTTPGDLSYATLKQVEELAAGENASVRR